MTKITSGGRKNNLKTFSSLKSVTQSRIPRFSCHPAAFAFAAFANELYLNLNSSAKSLRIPLKLSLSDNPASSGGKRGQRRVEGAARSVLRQQTSETLVCLFYRQFTQLPSLETHF